MAKRARLSGSAAHRWVECPRSVRLAEGSPGITSAAAAEGTLAHKIAAGALQADEYLVQRNQCNQEMLEGVCLYVDYLANTRVVGDRDSVELDLTPALSCLHPDLGGTADHVRERAASNHLFVTDFKYGAGHAVEPEDNKQLMLYALGALLDCNESIETVTVTIVQPRIEHPKGPIRSWTFPASQMIDFAADIVAAAERTRDPNAPLVPGETQCRWCPAKQIPGLCPAIEAKQQELIAAEFKDLVPYDPAALSKALSAIPLVEIRIKAIREFAYAEAERGNPPPGYKLVAKRGTRKWINDEAVASWAEARAIDAYDDPKLKSPAQLEKGLTKEQKAELAEMTVTVSSGHTLVRDDDKRPAVHLALASEFTVIEADK